MYTLSVPIINSRLCRKNLPALTETFKKAGVIRVLLAIIDKIDPYGIAIIKENK